MRRAELAFARALAPPGLDEFPVLVELHDSCIRVSAMPVGDEDVAVGCDDDGGRRIEGIGGLARHAGLAERHQNLSIRTELENLMPLPAFALPVGHPNV